MKIFGVGLLTTCNAAVFVLIARILLVIATTDTTESADGQVSTSGTDLYGMLEQIPGRSCRARCEASKTYDPDQCPPDEMDGPCLDSAGRCMPNAYICLAADTHDDRWPQDGSPRHRHCNGQTFDMRRQADKYRLCKLRTAIPDNEIQNASSQLWQADRVNRITVDVSWQGTTGDGSHEDMAPDPLFNKIPEEFASVPLYSKQIALFDIYIPDESVPDPLTPAEWAAIDQFLDEVMKTTVMHNTHEFLASKGLVPADASGFQSQLWEIWYSQYKRMKVLSSCGAEHVQIGETNGDKISGLHNWIRFALLEQSGHVNYLGNVRHASVGGEAYVIRNPFFWDEHYKPVGGFFIGTSPAFDMALYTLCYYARPNTKCGVNLGGTRLTIQTYSIEYDEHEHVASSYPTY